MKVYRTNDNREFVAKLPFGKDREKTILRLLREGLTKTQLIRKGYDPIGILAVANKYGINAPGRFDDQTSDLVTKTIMDKFTIGKTMSEISKETGLSRNIIRYYTHKVRRQFIQHVADHIRDYGIQSARNSFDKTDVHSAIKSISHDRPEIFHQMVASARAEGVPENKLRKHLSFSEHMYRKYILGSDMTPGIKLRVKVAKTLSDHKNLNISLPEAARRNKIGVETVIGLRYRKDCRDILDTYVHGMDFHVKQLPPQNWCSMLY